jgi:hypothetical protein
MPGFSSKSQLIIGKILSPGGNLGSVRASLSHAGCGQDPLGHNFQQSTTASSSFWPCVISSGSVGPAPMSIHSSSLVDMDELYLWAINNGSSSAEISIWFDDDRTFDGLYLFDRNVVVTTLFPSSSAVMIWPGIPISSFDESTPTVLYASGSTHSRISLHGYIIRRKRINPNDRLAGFDPSD